MLIEKNIDLLIIGGGPAGLAATIYAARAKIDFILIEDGVLGGQLKNSYTIENYPGFNSIEGKKLSELFYKQAIDLGANIDVFDNIRNIYIEEGNNIIETYSCTYYAKTIIIATGAVPKKLPIQGGTKYEGRGIHYCAICDGAMYSNKKIGVVGGGNSALEEALFLTRFAQKVYIIRRHDYFNGEKNMIDKVNNNPKIEILYNFDLIDVSGEDFVQKAIIKNIITGEVEEIELSAVFGYIGNEPKTKFIEKYIELNKDGYIITDENMQTNIPGVYAIGDVRDKKFRQITTAVADGTIAVLHLEKYFLNKKGGNC